MDLVNKMSEKMLAAFIKRPHSVLLVHSAKDRQQGLEATEYIFKSLRSSTTTQLYRIELKDKNSIGIDDIRDLQRYLTLKANDTDGYSKFVLISEAEKLTVEAQNSLLKVLEEVSKKTIIVLVATTLEPLLPTVLSRCFLIKIMPISVGDARNYGQKLGIEEAEIDKAYTISGGRVTVFKSLLLGDNEKVDNTIKLSKEFLQSSVFERQKIIQQIYTENITIDDFLQSLHLVARTGMRNAKEIQIKLNWKNKLKSIIKAQEQLKRNVQSKLIMLALSLSL